MSYELGDISCSLLSNEEEPQGGPDRDGEDTCSNEVRKLNPLIEHCLSASKDVNKQLAHSLAAYWRYRRNVDDRELGTGLSDFSSFPRQVVDYVKSHCFLGRPGTVNESATSHYSR